jgi:hypothetical protein
MALVATTVATLKAVWETAVARWAQAQALTLSDGDRPNFSIDGVSVDWPQYEEHLLKLIADAQKAYADAVALAVTVDAFDAGPVVVVTQGR